MDSGSDSDTSIDEHKIEPKDYRNEQEFLQEVCEREIARHINDDNIESSAGRIIHAWNTWNATAEPIIIVSSAFKPDGEQSKQLKRAFKKSCRWKRFESLIACLCSSSLSTRREI